MRTFLFLATVFGLSYGLIEFEELNHLYSVNDLKDTGYDCVIFINDEITVEGTQKAELEPLTSAIGEYKSVSHV